MIKERFIESHSNNEISRLLRPFSPVGIDLDGVMVNSVDVTLRVLNERIKKNLTLLDISHSYKLDDLYREALGCSQEEANAYLSSIWNSRECMEDAKPVHGAIELLRHFDEDVNVNYHFVTSRPFSVRGYTENWFYKNGLSAHFMKTIMQSSEVYNRHHKIDVIRDYGIKIFFEDMAEHAMGIINNTEALVVLVNYPANESLAEHPRIIRPKNRKNYGDLIGSYSELIRHLSTKSS